MNWTSLIGRRRPLEIDALRLATLIHQLGEAPAADETDGKVVRQILGEARLQTLDHLLRHPTTLAYVLIDQRIRKSEPADRSSNLARKVRQLLANERQQHQPTGRRRPWQTQSNGPTELTLHPFIPPRWQRLDDAMGFLASRDLAQVSVQNGNEQGPPQLSYGVTSTATELLERELYPKDRNSMLHLQLCGMIRDLLPPFSADEWQSLMQDIQRNLDQFCRDEQLPIEQDPLSVLFHNTFQEHL